MSELIENLREFEAEMRTAAEQAHSDMKMGASLRCIARANWLEDAITALSSPQPVPVAAEAEAMFEELLSSIIRLAGLRREALIYGSEGKFNEHDRLLDADREALRQHFKQSLSAQGGGVVVPRDGLVTLRIDDVRKLLGGFGTSHTEMEHPLMAELYKDHPEAMRRIAYELHHAQAEKGAEHGK